MTHSAVQPEASAIHVMHHYDPERAPNADEWLALDERDRMALVEEYHRAARISPPNIELHTSVHVVAENQIAETHEPVVRAMKRLRSTGLSRHDALHAIGSVLAEHLFELLRDTSSNDDPMANYDAALERLTAEGWRHDYG